jgi:hypothetical protein|nr:MAG TPA: Protein of unknown function (DUF2897) [Caudoviricetes sp.]
MILFTIFIISINLLGFTASNIAMSKLSSPKLPKPPLSKILPPRVRDVFGRNIARQS